MWHDVRSSLARWTLYSALAFLLHLAWEMAHMGAYRGIGDQPWISTLGRCSGAALFDVVVSVVLAAPVLRLWRSRRRSAWPWVAMAAAGAVVAVVMERVGLAAGRWAYGEAMPILPGFDVGLWPVVQMTLIPSLAGWLTLSRQ